MENTLIAALKYLMSPELRAKLADLGNGVKQAFEDGVAENIRDGDAFEQDIKQGLQEAALKKQAAQAKTSCP